MPCNAFVWCPDDVCFEPDAHHHTKGDCWLKFTEGPAYPEVGCTAAAVGDREGWGKQGSPKDTAVSILSYGLVCMS